MSEVWTKIKQTIDTSVSDREFVANFDKQLAMLTGMVEEMFVENKHCLLSPVMRQLMADKGREVNAIRQKLAGRLCADNPGENFK